jgi:hypothetical protein
MTIRAGVVPYRAVDVHRAGHGSLDLRPKILRRDLLEELGVKVAGIIVDDVDPAEPRDAAPTGTFGASRLETSIS